MSNKKEILSIKDSTLDTLKKSAMDLVDKSNKNFYSLGDTLNTIKALMDHAEFSNWVKNELDFSHNMANKYMKIAANLDEATAVKYKVRKSYSLACLTKDDREDFLSKFDIDDMSCTETETKIREFKLSIQAVDTTNKKSNHSMNKAKLFIKNIDTFKRSLSDKISSFVEFKDSIDDAELLQNMVNNKNIFAKLEELNLLIGSSMDEEPMDEVDEAPMDIDDPINCGSYYPSISEEYPNSNLNLY